MIIKRLQSVQDRANASILENAVSIGMREWDRRDVVLHDLKHALCTVVIFPIYLAVLLLFPIVFPLLGWFERRSARRECAQNEKRIQSNGH